MLKILLWTHNLQSEGVQLLMQSNHWCPALVAYLSVLIAFLMSFKWGNIKPCHVNLPQVGCWMGMSQKALLWCWDWCTTNTALEPAPTGLICWWRSLMGLLLPANPEEDALCRFPGVNLPWQQESRTAPSDLATCSCRSFCLRSKGTAPPRHSLAIPLGLCYPLWKSHPLDTEGGEHGVS